MLPMRISKAAEEESPIPAGMFDVIMPSKPKNVKPALL